MLYSLQHIHLPLWDGDSRFYRYKLETSPDGKRWTEVVDRSSGEWRSWQMHHFSPRPVQYIRVHGTYNSRNSNWHAVELEAYCRDAPHRKGQ